jgi:hypothetical protein
MALKFSTCLRNKILGAVPERGINLITGTGIAAVDGGAGADSFTDTGNGFITAGFSVGDAVIVYGFTGSMAAIHGPFTLTSVAAGTIEVATGLLAGDEAGETVVIVGIKGGSLKDIFKDGVLKIYNGTQPTSPDNSIGGATALVTITVSNGAFVPGAVTNGLEFGAPALGVIAKNTEVWSGVVAASGTASWYRFYANTADAGAADTTYIYPRIDGAVGTSGRELNVTSVYLTAGASCTVDSFSITLPES